MAGDPVAGITGERTELIEDLGLELLPRDRVGDLRFDGASCADILPRTASPAPIVTTIRTLTIPTLLPIITTIGTFTIAAPLPIITTIRTLTIPTLLPIITTIRTLTIAALLPIVPTVRARSVVLALASVLGSAESTVVAAMGPFTVAFVVATAGVGTPAVSA